MVLRPQELLKDTDTDKRAVIALSEGSDPRVVAGAVAARDAGLADSILIGECAVIRSELAALGLAPDHEWIFRYPAPAPTPPIHCE